MIEIKPSAIRKKFFLLSPGISVLLSMVRKFLLPFFFFSATVAFSQNHNPSPSVENNEEVNKAHAMLEAVKSADRFIHQLDSLYTVDLPVGIVSRNGREGENYAILISAVRVKNGQTFIDAWMAFTVPGSGKKIAFKGVNIPISFNGGVSAPAKLVLVSDFDIAITNDITMVLKGDGSTFVAFDCQGFREMSLSAGIFFNSQLFVPENEDGSPREGEVLQTSFQTTITDWNDMLVKVSLAPFQFKPLKGFGFRVTNAVMDMSDFANPAGVVFPEKYATAFFIDGNPLVWRGFYLQEAEIRMPPQFKKRSGTDRPAFFVQHLLLDDMGFTARLMAEKLMTLEEGTMGGWAFSVEKMAVDIQASQIVGGAFSGQLQLPFFRKEDVFNYTAQIGTGGNYAFGISSTQAYHLSLWAAQLTVDPHVSMTVTAGEKEFLPVITLNGNLSLQAPVNKDDSSSQKLAIAEVPFQGMKIETVEPYLSVQHVSFGTQQNSFSNFPVSVREISIVNQSNRLGLRIGLTVNFVKESEGGFGGKGVFTVWGRHDKGKWKYDGVEIDKIAVDMEKPGVFALHGMVMFMGGDATYGNVFKGELQAKMVGFGMGALALFGNVNGYRYWYADALVETRAGIPCGPLSLYGFGGGAYNHMKQSLPGSVTADGIGKSLSGIVYIPDERSGPGITASVKYGLTANQNTMNGDARLEVNFTSTGGVNQISLSGNAYFATSHFQVSATEIMDKAKYIVGKTGLPDIPEDVSFSALWGKASMVYDFLNSSFHSTFSVYVNVAGGVVKGTGPAGLAGSGVMHFDPVDWYIQLGTPANPNGIEILNVARMSNYFMAGKNIPDKPVPPEKVVRGLSATGKSYATVREDGGSIGNGFAFAFGAAFDVNTGEKTFLMFYGKFACSIGFDVLMKNYGAEAICDDNSTSFGINGWYAMGQAYGWILANVGIKVDLPFYSGKYSIFDIYAASLMQVKAPNPFWMKGNVCGYYNILNGLVKGSCDFEFEIGKQCKNLSGNPLGGMAVIADIKPSDKETDVSVFSTPQVIFNMPVDKEFEFQDENKVTKKYRIRLQKFIVSGINGQVPEGSFSWNVRHDVVVFNPKNILPGETEMKVEAIVSFEEYKGNGWFDVKKEGKTAIETKTITFRTGKQPDYVSQENVAYSYPGYRAFNYYPAESSDNYIKLKQGHRELFRPSKEWKQKARLIPVGGGQPVFVDFAYDSTNDRINFRLPSQMTGNTIYRFEIVNIPASDATALDANVIQKDHAVVQQTDGNATQVRVTKQEAGGSRLELKEKVIYSMEFRSSNFSTFTDKLNNLSYSEGIRWEIYPLVHSLTVNIRGERFDRYEVINLATNTMVRIDPLVKQSAWYVTNIAPLIELDDETLRRIGAQPFTLPALASYFFQENGTRNLTEEEISSGSATDVSVISGINYCVAKYLSDYLYYLKNKAANAGYKATTASPQIARLLLSTFPPLTKGSYPINIHFLLPGQQNPSSTTRYNILW